MLRRLVLFAVDLFARLPGVLALACLVVRRARPDADAKVTLRRDLLAVLEEPRLLDVLREFATPRVLYHLSSAQEAPELLERLVRGSKELATREKSLFDGAVETAWQKNEITLDYALRVAAGQLEVVRRFRPSLEGAHVLELGPGYSLAPGLFFRVKGAARYTGTDLHPIGYATSAFYRRLRDRIATEPLVPVAGAEAARATALARFDEAVDLSGDAARFDDARVGLRCPVDAAALPFEAGSVDVILSNAAFEHFAKPEDAIRETARVLRPGGLAVHQIDLRDHRDFAAPREFLTVSKERWLELNAAGSFIFTNRWRRGDFARAFAAAGFDVLEVEVDKRADVAPVRGRLHADYASLPDDEVAAVAARFVVRKRGAS